MPAPKPPAFETLSLHAGQHPDPVTRSRAVPIYQTTSYVFDDADHAAALFNLERAGHIYTRISNPTTAVLEERLAALEQAASARSARRAAWRRCISPSPRCSAPATTSSPRPRSTAAPSISSPTRCRASASPRPSSSRATSTASARRSAKTPGWSSRRPSAIPASKCSTFPKVAEIAHAAGIPLLIDNTFATPYLSRPIELGADLVMHSITKWIGGHGIAIGGVIVDGGRFDWQASDKFPTLTEPYAGYHGIVFAEEFGPSAFIMRARAEGLRDFGACLSPTNAFHLLQGVETLAAAHGAPHGEHGGGARLPAARTRRSNGCCTLRSQAIPITRWRRQLLPKGAGSIVSFGIKGGRAAGRKFIEAVRLASHLANVGDAKTLVIHPASTTHQQMDAAALEGRRRRRGTGAPLDRPRGGKRHRRRSRAGAARLAEGLSDAHHRRMAAKRSSRPAARDFDPRAAAGRLPARRRARSFGLGAAGALRSRITAAACWRPIFPGTAARRARRLRRSPPWPTGRRR